MRGGKVGPQAGHKQRLIVCMGNDGGYCTHLFSTDEQFSRSRESSTKSDDGLSFCAFLRMCYSLIRLAAYWPHNLLVGFKCDWPRCSADAPVIVTVWDQSKVTN